MRKHATLHLLAKYQTSFIITVIWKSFFRSIVCPLLLSIVPSTNVNCTTEWSQELLPDSEVQRFTWFKAGTLFPVYSLPWSERKSPDSNSSTLVHYFLGLREWAITSFSGSNLCQSQAHYLVKNLWPVRVVDRNELLAGVYTRPGQEQSCDSQASIKGIDEGILWASVARCASSFFYVTIFIRILFFLHDVWVRQRRAGRRLRRRPLGSRVPPTEFLEYVHLECIEKTAAAATEHLSIYNPVVDPLISYQEWCGSVSRGSMFVIVCSLPTITRLVVSRRLPSYIVQSFTKCSPWSFLTAAWHVCQGI
jgi:hypothetical protein